MHISQLLEVKLIVSLFMKLIKFWKSQSFIVIPTVLNDNITPNIIGGGSRKPWPLLNFKTLHRNSIFAIENHLSLAKWPPNFQ